jgi:transcription termination factor Rho
MDEKNNIQEPVGATLAVAQNSEQDRDKEKKSKELTDAFAKKASEISKAYPGSGELYFTTDGYAFFQKNDAQNHAQSLENKIVVTIKNK